MYDMRPTHITFIELNTLNNNTLFGDEYNYEALTPPPHHHYYHYCSQHSLT
jgi:hypothetical protein